MAGKAFDDDLSDMNTQIDDLTVQKAAAITKQKEAAANAALEQTETTKRVEKRIALAAENRRKKYEKTARDEQLAREQGTKEMQSLQTQQQLLANQLNERQNYLNQKETALQVKKKASGNVDFTRADVAKVHTALATVDSKAQNLLSSKYNCCSDGDTSCENPRNYITARGGVPMEYKKTKLDDPPRFKKAENSESHTVRPGETHEPPEGDEVHSIINEANP